MIVCARYDDAVIKKAIHHFKYEHFFDIGRILGKILAERLATEKNKEGFLIIPVPLHNLKKAQRGFNQAEILAKVVALSSDRPYLSNILVRQKYRRPQMELSREKRLENLKGSFCWLGGDLKRAEVILVDDVATTGATLEECAKVLKKSGAGEVWGLVLAHG
ncbi:ComF family protein [Candidatus Microgenomates bacterium]|nr:ComF family protein [Candidatus Microgenomates bacterium]